MKMSNLSIYDQWLVEITKNKVLLK